MMTVREQQALIESLSTRLGSLANIQAELVGSGITAITFT